MRFIAKDSGVTFLEMVIALVIIAILACVAYAGFTKQIESAAEKQARVTLKIIWGEEKDVYSFRGKYVSEKGWQDNQLNIPYTNNDNKYIYEIIKPEESDVEKSELEIRAKRKNSTHGFSINIDGEITRF